MDQSSTSVPLKARIRSPSCSPAAYAGVSGSVAVHSRLLSEYGTAQRCTSATFGSVTGSPMLPYVAKRPPKMTNAIAMFTEGPAAITMTFFHQAIL